MLFASCSNVITEIKKYEANKPPVISSVKKDIADGTPLIPGLKISLTIEAYDPEKEDLAYSISSETGAIKNLKTSKAGCSVDFYIGENLAPAEKVIINIKAIDKVGDSKTIQYDAGSGKTGPSITLSGSFPGTIEMNGIISGQMTADSDGYYQIQILDDTSAAISFDSTQPCFFYKKNTTVDFTIYGPSFSNEYSPQLNIPIKSPDKVAIIVKDTLGLEGSAEFSVTVNGPQYEDKTVPYVSLTSPLLAERVHGINKISAVATDNYAIDKVDFYVDDVLVNTDSTYPYEIEYDYRANQPGIHTVKAVGYDLFGNSSYHFYNNIEVCELPLHYGDGKDGDITILTGNTVNISELYNNDVVTGVITWRGTNKGLNHSGLDPSDTYSPSDGRFVQAKNFIIQSTAVLSEIAWGNGTDNANGIVWIGVTKTFTIQGSIDMNGKGGAIGVGLGAGRDGNPGYNASGFFCAWMGNPAGGVGGNSYTAIENSIWPFENPNTVWASIYGSGGGYGKNGVSSGGSCGFGSTGGNGGNGGLGGGAIHIVAFKFEISKNSTISVNGTNGENGTNGINGNRYGTTAGSGGGAGGHISSGGNGGYGGGNNHYNCDSDCSWIGGSGGGGGGGGSAGTIYIETLSDISLMINRISAIGGNGGIGGVGAVQYGENGGSGSNGRIAVRISNGVTITGQTTPNYYNIYTGSYSAP